MSQQSDPVGLFVCFVDVSIFRLRILWDSRVVTDALFEARRMWGIYSFACLADCPLRWDSRAIKAALFEAWKMWEYLALHASPTARASAFLLKDALVMWWWWTWWWWRWWRWWWRLGQLLCTLLQSFSLSSDLYLLTSSLTMWRCCTETRTWASLMSTR